MSRVLVGRAAAVLFWLCGVSILVGLLLPAALDGRPTGVYVASAAAAAAAGVVIWFLPWARWPRWASLFLVPVGFALVALQSTLASSDFRVHEVLFFLFFSWIGVALPRWTALKALPLFAAAYLLPLVLEGRFSWFAMASAAFVGLACLLAGETLAWFSMKLRLRKVALRHVEAAIDDIGLELASATDLGKLWSSIALRLSAVVGLPDCDVYRLTNDGKLICLASVYGGEPCPGYLGPRREQDVWAVDRTAVRTKNTVFVASPADPRLSGAEREGMREWGERAMLIVPLVARAEVVGLVEMSETREGHTITPEQISTVVSVCRFIAIALHDADITIAEKATARRLAALLESSRAVASVANLEEALAVVTSRAGDVLGVSRCVVYEHDPERDAIVPRAMWERTPSGRDRQGEPLSLADRPMSRVVLDSGRSLAERLSDPQLDPASSSDLNEWGEGSRLTLSMQSIDGPLGLLTFWDKETEREYSDQDLALASALAEIAGAAVHGAKLRSRLRRSSEPDAKMGFANRRELHEFLRLQEARAEKQSSCFSLVMLDLDGFESLNDTYGHSAGDEVLRMVAALLSEQTRAIDGFGRYGDDEFLLVLTETTAAQAGLLAERLCATLAETPHVTAAGEQITIGASFGIAAYPEDGRDADALVAVAEANLHSSRVFEGGAATGGEQDQGSRDGKGARTGPPSGAIAPPPREDVSPVTAELHDRDDEPASGETVRPPRRVWDEGITIDLAEMRRRIEETRTRLKVKAFDAIMRGESALLRDGGEVSEVVRDNSRLDADLEGLVDVALSEDER